MTNPTPEQIEAGRKAVLANFHAPTDLNPTWHLNPEEVAHAVLVAAAAAGATPQEPPMTIEDLNRAFGSRIGGPPSFTAEGEGDEFLFGRPRVPMQVDEAKLASMLQEHRPSQWRSFANDTIVYRCCGQDFGRLTGKPRKTDREPRELWEEHMASKLAEWLRGGGQ